MTQQKEPSPESTFLSLGGSKVKRVVPEAEERFPVFIASDDENSVISCSAVSEG